VIDNKYNQNPAEENLRWAQKQEKPMKLTDKQKELFKQKETHEISEEQVTKPITEVKLVPNEKEINEAEYNTYELHIWGSENGLQELSDLIENLQNKQEKAQASLVMKAVGVTPENDDDDVWWSTCRVMENSLIIYEYLKCPFMTKRISRVIHELKNTDEIDPGAGNCLDEGRFLLMTNSGLPHHQWGRPY